MQSERLSEIIYRFTPVGLEEIDSVRLMNRQDVKFTTDFDKLLPILDKIKDDYLVLEIDGKRVLNYKTTYLDTRDFAMYLAHHNNKLNRYKIRFREYVDTNSKYLEVKFKTNTNRTIKDRIKISDTSIKTQEAKQNEKKIKLNTKCEKFIRKRTPFLFEQLEQKVSNRFSRITIVNKKKLERITIDFGLEYLSVEKIIELKTSLLLK